MPLGNCGLEALAKYVWRVQKCAQLQRIRYFSLPAGKYDRQYCILFPNGKAHRAGVVLW